MRKLLPALFCLCVLSAPSANASDFPAPVAQALYAETEASIALRAKQAEQRRFGTEPAQAIEQGRPSKRDRRKLADWDRWSAAAEAPPRGRS